MKDLTMTTCAKCGRAIYKDDVDESGKCCDCQEVVVVKDDSKRTFGGKVEREKK